MQTEKSVKRKISFKRKAMLGTLALLVFVLVVNATMLTFYGRVETTVTVEQTVLFDGEACNVVEEAVEMTTGTCTVSYHWMENPGIDPVLVDVTTTADFIDGIDVSVFVFPEKQQIRLENKNESSWEAIEDGRYADITFNSYGCEFSCAVEAFGLEPLTEYTLIYYADQQDRFVYWGGGDPLVQIGTFVTDEFGDETTAFVVSVDNLPVADDWNRGNDADYTLTPDFYDHAKGAKFWIVPSSEIVSDVLTDWNPDDYLFETELGVFYYCQHPFMCSDFFWPDTRSFEIGAGELVHIFICTYADALLEEGEYFIVTEFVPGTA